MLINISTPLFKRGVLKACTVRCSAEPAVHVLSRTLTDWNTCSTRGACTLSGTRVGRRPNDGGPACFTFQQEQTSTRSRAPTAGESVCFWAQGEGGEAFDVTPASTVQVEIMEWVTESSLESGTAPAAAAGDPAVQKLLKQLMEMGFSENGSKRAMVACSRCPLPPGTPNQLYQPRCFCTGRCADFEFRANVQLGRGRAAACWRVHRVADGPLERCRHQRPAARR